MTHVLRLTGGLAGLALAIAAPAQTTNTVRSITLQESFEMALQENLDLKIQRINPNLAHLDLEIARAGYDPRFTFVGTHSDSTSAGGRDANNIEFEGSKAETDSFRSSLGGLGPYGLSYSLNGNANDTHGVQPDRLDPTLRVPFETSSGSVGINLSQPILRNFLFDPVRYDIAVAKNRIKGTELDLRNDIINLINNVEKAYNLVIFTREFVKVQEEALRLARQLMTDNQRRVQIGTLSPLDAKQSESEVYARQSDLSTAARAQSTAQNNLKRFLTSSYQTLHDVTLQPSEALVAVPERFDLLESWQAGMAKRPDIQQARRTIELQGITLKYTKNQRLPELDITGSYGYGGSGGREFSETFGNISSRDQPFWSIGAVAAMPLSNKAAREAYRRARAVGEQLVLNLKRQEETAMVEIDETINAIKTAQDRIESTRQARIYAEQALEGGQKRLQAGTGTSFEVLQLQRDLISARVSEIDAIKDYNNARSDLFRAEGTTLERKKINVETR